MPGLAAKGLIVIDASDRPGTGALGDYRITANSVGDVFIDCLRDPALREVFEPLENSAAYWRIKAQAQSAPQLSDVGLLMAEASRLVLDHIVQRYGVEVWSGTRLDEVICEGDEFCLHVDSVYGKRRVRCQALVLNLGGRQDPQHLIDDLARQGLTLPDHCTVQSADRLLRMNAVQLREVFAPALADNGRITIVGDLTALFRRWRIWRMHWSLPACRNCHSSIAAASGCFTKVLNWRTRPVTYLTRSLMSVRFQVGSTVPEVCVTVRWRSGAKRCKAVA